MPLFAPPPPLVGGCSLIASLRRTIRNGRLSQDSHLPCLGEYIDLSIEFQLTILQVFRCRSGRRKAEELHLCGTLCIAGVDDFVLLLRLVVLFVEGPSTRPRHLREIHGCESEPYCKESTPSIRALINTKHAHSFLVLSSYFLFPRCSRHSRRGRWWGADWPLGGVIAVVR